MWRAWREELFVIAGELWGTGESSIQLHSLTVQGVSNKMSFIRHLPAFATNEEEVQQTTGSFMSQS